MTALDAEWFGEPPETDARLIEEAPGGALSELGRQAAVEASLSLLGVYFSSGDQDLSERSAASRTAAASELEELLAGLRLRVALAAGRRLLTFLENMARRPTFRYQLVSTEQVGSLSGALDINRWVTRQRGGDQDLSFPVSEVRRGSRTPENTLASYATQWLTRELRDSFRASTASVEAVEYRAVRRLRERLERAQRIPALADCRQDAQTIRTRVAVERLISQVRRRLQRREIAHPGPYRKLVEWIDECLAGVPTVEPGAVDLSAYGDSFDSKLYELWCLGALGRALARAFNLPEPRIGSAWRRTGAAYQFEVFAGRLDLFFQRSLSSVDAGHAATWKRENGRRLGGIPDIVVRAHPTAGNRRYAVIDPKLRQRQRLPSEELYKILGYLQNFGVQPPVGVVLIYTTSTDAVEPDVFTDGAGGILMSVALNPAAPSEVVDAALESVVAVVLNLIEYQSVGAALSGSDADQGDAERTEGVIDAARSSLTAWGRSHLAEIGPSRERLATLVGEERWQVLSEDVQVMMATADLIGHQLDPAADFSGPVIGMCAAVEHLLHAAVITPVTSGNHGWQRQTRTLGAALDTIDLACRGRGSQLPRDVQTHMLSADIDPTAVAGLIPAWRRMNTAFRVPAAHRQVITRADWQRLYRLVIGGEALFTQTYDALYAQAGSTEDSSP